MSNVVCKKCGAEASSKCPYCRTIFPVDQQDAVLSHLIKRKITGEPGARKLELTYFIGDDWDEEKAVHDLAVILKNILDGKKYWPTLKSFCCHHEWEFKPGEHSTIGCGH